jgi:pyruvate dehydrogenase E1 component beta subunit
VICVAGTREITFAEAIREALLQEMERDESVFLMGEDIGRFGGIFGVTRGLYEKFPQRIRDTPISEMAFVGCGIGAAICGMRPVVEIMFTDFLSVPMDQIYNHAAKFRYMFGGQVKIPIVIRGPFGAGIRGAAHHSQSIYSIFAHIPGLKVVVPSTPYDAKGLLIAAIRDDNPVLFFEHKRLYGIKGPVPEESYTVPLGEAKVAREGDDITIVASAMMFHKSLEAASTLENYGIRAEVIDLRTLSPLDKKTVVNSVKRTGRLLVVDEGYPKCGIADHVASIVSEEAFEYLDAPIRKVTPPDTPVPFSPVLEDFYLPDSKKIVETAKSILT